MAGGFRIGEGGRSGRGAPRPPRPRALARPRGFVSGGVAPRTSPCSACNPSSHFLVDSLKAAAVAAQNKGHCLASSCGAASFPESPFLDRRSRLQLRPGEHTETPPLCVAQVPRRRSQGRRERDEPGLLIWGPRCKAPQRRPSRGGPVGTPRPSPARLLISPRPAVTRAFISWWLL